MTATPSANKTLQNQVQEILHQFGIKLSSPHACEVLSVSPINGELLGSIRGNTVAEAQSAISQAYQAYGHWRSVPAPRRGELIRLFGEELRLHKEALGRLVTIECGKILQEGLGEVQEMIDICDFAVGLSRQLYGLTMASERPGHRMMETWHPLGIVALITPFNFPVAVWAWNFALAVVCGNATIWKPSEKTPLTATACQALFERALKKFGAAPDALSLLLHGGQDIAEAVIDHPQVALVSATGSTEMGRAVGQRVAKRFGKVLLELGGNNAMIVTPSANLDLAYRAITFSAVGTCGQRCTTLRRLIVHRSLKEQVIQNLKNIYQTVPIGNPLESATLCGPLIDETSFLALQATIAQAQKEGGTLVTGGIRVLDRDYPQGYYVAPALIDMPKHHGIVHTETFAPILYVLSYETLEEAIAINNEVPQGLSSCIFTNSLQEAELFLSACGSDCGIANVNIGPSGAEIGGAFGGDKETGGGRESGSDSWRNYMRRATNTVNFSSQLPLAQGIQFNF
ncbi:L-piperidine-6-carboxylate dehydrogenase [Candidatus Odyssella thessalonicensis]|uniref:L-piperidine-6-carboxylate dehydrogenase n=1 Tax=Candidatus Odyssella thessalonicensis TaxID=84647 RepID=UPI000225BED2|nr:aldehyde dehydrogenase family protein [Candidatus Odyssella thessalonicensis]